MVIVVEQTKKNSTLTIVDDNFHQKRSGSKIEMKPEKMYNEVIGTEEKEVSNMSQQYVTEKDLSQLEEKIDLKIQNAVQPLEGKIDNLQTSINGKFDTLEQKLENMFLLQKIEIKSEFEEKQKEDKKEKRNILIAVITGIVVPIVLFVISLFI